MHAIIRAVRKHTADIIFGVLALVLGAAALIGYGAAGDGVLRVLLWPHAKITEAFYNTALIYQNGVGYISGGFTIGPACMGMNFIVMLFCFTVCVFTRRFKGIYKAAFFMLSVIGSAAAGVIISCIRIIGSVPFLSFARFTTIHTAVGITLYLAALMGSYILINKATGGSYEKQ